MDNKLERELKRNFKETFDKKSLDRDFYNRLEEKIEREKRGGTKIINKIKKSLDHEIEIDIKAVIAAAVLMVSLPTIFSLKEITREYRENMKSIIELRNNR